MKSPPPVAIELQLRHIPAWTKITIRKPVDLTTYELLFGMHYQLPALQLIVRITALDGTLLYRAGWR